MCGDDLVVDVEVLPVGDVGHRLAAEVVERAVALLVHPVATGPRSCPRRCGSRNAWRRCRPAPCRQPSAMNSAASRQVSMPPMPEIGMPWRLRVAGDLGHHVQRDRLHRRAAIAAMRALAVDRRRRAPSGRDRPSVIELMVLISETASAPPCLAARAGVRMSVTLGVSLTMHRHARVLLAPARDHLDVFRHLAHRRAHAALGHAVRAAEIELDRRRRRCPRPAAGSLFQRSSSQGTISETTIARSGQSRLTCLISAG